MVKIDLITGFLGSGKTTFIKKYAKYLMEQGLNICILENDYGAVNVDMMLLQDLAGDRCELEMVAGGCDYDCHKRRFKTKLISMGMCGYDRVIVEPSGIFDVDEFFDVLYEEPLDRWYEIGSVIAIVDAGMSNDMSKESDYLLASQLANAGAVVFSRSQNVSGADIDEKIAHINSAMELVGCKRRFKADNDIINKDWDELTGADFERIMSCGYRQENYVKFLSGDDYGYSSLYFMNVKIPVAKLKDRAEKLLNDASCGKVFRIKGFMLKEDGDWIELNATHDAVNIKPIETGQEVLIVIGEELNEDNIKKYWNR